ncbi:hypothetical protein BBP40_010868 [Aspergillus hancockii]|nr:hypothetical protein BBP40_010868 [Aspergillus hancockii]
MSAGTYKFLVPIQGFYVDFAAISLGFGKKPHQLAVGFKTDLFNEHLGPIQRTSKKNPQFLSHTRVVPLIQAPIKAAPVPDVDKTFCNQFPWVCAAPGTGKCQRVQAFSELR